MGQLISMWIVQGSSAGIPFLAPPVYEYFCGANIEDVVVEFRDVPTQDVRDFLEKVHGAAFIYP